MSAPGDLAAALGTGLPGLALLFAAALAAGAVNAVAGGGTILTFPVLAAILPPDPARMVVANITSTIGIWPGAAAAAWAYRDDRAELPGWAGWLIVPSVAGAVAGTLLVVLLPPAWFDGLVPGLILLAAVLFALQPRFAALVGAAAGPRTSAAGLAAACAAQFVVAVYGGYFGAGIGILMLAVLSLLGLGDIHRVNGVKNVLGMTINGVAAAMFAMGALVGGHEVAWPHAAVMAGGSVLGSLGASRVARRLPAAVVRRMVAVIGFALAGYYWWRRFVA